MAHNPANNTEMVYRGWLDTDQREGKMRGLLMAIGAAIAAIGYHSANAGSVSTNGTVLRAAPLQAIVTGVVADCTWPPGTVVATLGSTGGNGKPVTYAFVPPAPADIAISGNKLVIGAKGITSGDCGTIEHFIINPTQPP